MRGVRDQRQPLGAGQRAARARHRPDRRVQVVYNIFDQAPEDELFPLCQRARHRRHRARAVRRRQPDRHADARTRRWPEGDWRNIYFTPDNLRDDARAGRAAASRSCPTGWTCPSWRCASSCEHPAVSTVIPGMRRAAARRAQPGGQRRRAGCRRACVDALRRHRWDRDDRDRRRRRPGAMNRGFAGQSPEDAKELAVKEGIHPKYHDVEARCACGATWKTRSTKQELHLEICSSCHPFFTGRQKLLDTEGRVERFTKKFGAQTSESRKTAEKAAKARRSRQRTRRSLDQSFSSSNPRVTASPSFRSIRARRCRAAVLPPLAPARAASVLQREQPSPPSDRARDARDESRAPRSLRARLALGQPRFDQLPPAARGLVESPLPRAVTRAPARAARRSMQRSARGRCARSRDSVTARSYAPIARSVRVEAGRA